MSSKVISRICSQGKKLRQICGNFFLKFKKQIKLRSTNEPRKESKGIEELESQIIIVQNQLLKIKEQNLHNKQEIKELEQYGRRLSANK